MAEQGGLARSIRFGGYLAILFGAFGVVFGIVGAATFIPYRSLDGLTLLLAQQLTAVSAIGAFVSAAGAVSGWALLRSKGWAWGGSVGLAFAAVGTVSAMGIIWPASAPFIGVAAFFYAIEVILLVMGLGSFRARLGHAIPA